MSKHKLSVRQIVIRTFFMLIAILLVSWFFPHNEAFRYEYEVGKPWRYGRLTAPYGFAIYRSDSALQVMEDSLRQQIVPRFMHTPGIADEALRQSHVARNQMQSEAYRHLRHRLESLYSNGILLGEKKDQLLREGCQQVILKGDTGSAILPLAQIPTELEVYAQLKSDSLYSHAYSAVNLREFIHNNLELDTAAMRFEYARIRQQVSATSGVILAESRIIDQGEIVTPRTYEILESYRREQQQRLSLASSEMTIFLSRTCIVALILCSILLFLALYRPWLYFQQAEVFVAVAAVTLMVILTAEANKMVVGGVYLVPIGIVTILLSTFHGSRTAYYCHIVMVLLCSFIAPSHFEYLVIQCIVGMIIVFSLKDGLTDRSQLMHVSIFSAIGYTGLYALYTLATEGSLTNISLPIVTMMVINAVLLLMSYLIIYMMERSFGFMSGVTLVELCNLGRGLLLRLSQEAPGTFQHSLQVANLTASAAKAIGANASLVRTGAMYHDIGKLWNPNMYTENQQGPNPHDKLKIEESVEIIKRHVAEGLKLAQKEKLPREISEFIQTHHGNSLIKYFYVTWCNAHPNEEPDPQMFTYPYPDPITKEQALLMMGDGIEAASRSLKEYSHDSIAKLVNGMIDNMVSTGRLNNAKITLREIQACKDSFIHDLESIYHARIEYPELHK